VEVEDSHLLSRVTMAVEEWSWSMRMMCVNRAFHTPSSTSCSRPTTRSEYTLRSGRQVMKAFFDPE